MARTVINVNDEMLGRAQRALGTTTKKDTINAALEVAAAVDADRRARLVEELRDLLGRLDVEAIEARPEVHQDEAA